MTSASASIKVMNFTSNIVALSRFVAAGNVAWTISLVMAAGQLIGARVSSNIPISNEVGFI